MKWRVKAGYKWQKLFLLHHILKTISYNCFKFSEVCVTLPSTGHPGWELEGDSRLLVHRWFIPTSRSTGTAKHLYKYTEHFLLPLPPRFLHASDDGGNWASSGVHVARSFCLLLVTAIEQRRNGSLLPSLPSD